MKNPESPTEKEMEKTWDALNEFIWNTLLKSLEHGSVSALECAREFAENNGFPVKEVEKYEEEFKAWGFDAYGY